MIWGQYEVLTSSWCFEPCFWSHYLLGIWWTSCMNSVGTIGCIWCHKMASYRFAVMWPCRAINGPNGCKNTAGCAHSDPPCLADGRRHCEPDHSLAFYKHQLIPVWYKWDSVDQISSFFLFFFTGYYIHLVQLFTNCLWLAPLPRVARFDWQQNSPNRALIPPNCHFQGCRTGVGNGAEYTEPSRGPTKTPEWIAMDLGAHRECLCAGSRSLCYAPGHWTVFFCLFNIQYAWHGSLQCLCLQLFLLMPWAQDHELIILSVDNNICFLIITD